MEIFGSVMVVISVSFHQYLCAQPSSQKERALGGAIAPLIRAAVLPLFSIILRGAPKPVV